MLLAGDQEEEDKANKNMRSKKEMNPNKGQEEA